MTAKVFNMRDYESKRRVPVHDQTLEQQAVSIFNVALADHLDDTAPLISESLLNPAWTPIGPGTIYHYADDKIYTDTAPCEYVAPESDPA
jgi:hypothetical protein